MCGVSSVNLVDRRGVAARALESESDSSIAQATGAKLGIEIDDDWI